jgi:hypothetical protein
LDNFIKEFNNNMETVCMLSTAESCVSVGSSNSRDKGRWTKEEDDRLRNAVKLYGHNNWKQVCTLVGTRDNGILEINI